MRAQGGRHAPRVRLPGGEQRLQIGPGVVLRRHAGQIAYLQPLPPVRDVPVNPGGNRAEPFDIGPAMDGQLDPRVGQLLVPGVQRGRQGRLGGDGLQRLVALLQRPGIALQRVVIGGANLGQRHVHEAPALGRAVLHGAQVLGGEQHAGDVAHQLAGPGDFLPRHPDPAPPQRGQGDLHLVASVPAHGLHPHRREIRPPADQLPILPRAVGAPGTAQVQRLQHVGLALAVVAQQHVHALAGLQHAGLVAAKLLQFRPCNLQEKSAAFR